ncbi:MMPL family transporter [Legionella fairfieldensis]|uniref:MMPL family transporter n=1 Tax=Legionella fairfieldensis TaxID=45064 RepID=UPI00055C2C57|nr:MMPL family transporter [Legionella fairfieldensis]
MRQSKFYRLGELVYRGRWTIIGLWFLIILACLPFLPTIITPFKTTGFTDDKAESTQVQEYLNKTLGYSNYNKFIIIYSSKKLLATQSSYKEKIKESLAGLKHFPIEHSIILPDSKEQRSKDKHTSYVIVILKRVEPISHELVATFKSLIKTPSQMTVEIGGEPVFTESVNEQTQIDLYKADFIATPVSIITLLLIFGSLVAALLPIVLGGGCAVIILTSLYFLGLVFSLSIFTLNIALLLGLCLSLDYALFIISRFRDELTKGLTIKETIACTQATAGKAVLFSGLAVFISLSALLLFPVNILFSVAIGGLVAVFVAVLTAIILLPAVLSVLNTRINLLPIRIFKRSNTNRSTFWHWLATKVVNRPLLFFVSSLLLLLMLGYPFLSTLLGVSDFRIFPIHSEQRHFFDTYVEKFDEKTLSPISLVVKTERSPILSRNNISKLYDLARELKQNPLIEQIHGIVTPDSSLTKSQYYALYQAKEHWNTKIKQLLDTTTRNYFTVMTIVGKYKTNSPEMKQLITDLRDIKVRNMTLQLTGTPVSNVDLLASISHILPYALLWIIVFTYLILLVLLRSLFLPLKAILMNVLSLSACYGALVLVFQEGYLHEFLNFEPQGMLDISLLVIIFCALFGFSMDYEVFLLSRIKEAHDLYQDNNKSIIFGIEKSSRIITSAAIIVIFICGSFLVADVLMVKAFGLGIAVAIFVDAFIIRTILVPSTMALVKNLNWYLPRWLDRILP